MCVPDVIKPLTFGRKGSRIFRGTKIRLLAVFLLLLMLTSAFGGLLVCLRDNSIT